MSDQIFFDTNVIVYLYSNNEIDKKNIVESILENNANPAISTQVINEFVYVMHRKRKVSYQDLKIAVKELSASFTIFDINLSTINAAIKIAEKYQYSYFDSLIIACAIENNCDVLYTEDLQNTQIIENVLEIRNPFIEIKS